MFAFQLAVLMERAAHGGTVEEVTLRLRREFFRLTRMWRLRQDVEDGYVVFGGES